MEFENPLLAGEGILTPAAKFSVSTAKILQQRGCLNKSKQCIKSAV